MQTYIRVKDLPPKKIQARLPYIGASGKGQSFLFYITNVQQYDCRLTVDTAVVG